MMDWTDRHCRVFHRLLSRRAPFATSVPRRFEALAVLWIARIGVVILWFRAAVDRRLPSERGLVFDINQVEILAGLEVIGSAGRRYRSHVG